MQEWWNKTAILQSVPYIPVMLFTDIYIIYKVYMIILSFFNFSFLPEVLKTVINILLCDSYCLEQILMKYSVMLQSKH